MLPFKGNEGIKLGGIDLGEVMGKYLGEVRKRNRETNVIKIRYMHALDLKELMSILHF